MLLCSMLRLVAVTVLMSHDLSQSVIVYSIYNPNPLDTLEGGWWV